MTSAMKKTTRKKKQNTKLAKTKISKQSSLSHYLKLKAPSNNVKMQSDKSLTIQIYFS